MQRVDTSMHFLNGIIGGKRPHTERQKQWDSHNPLETNQSARKCTFQSKLTVKIQDFRLATDIRTIFHQRTNQ